MRRGAHRQKLNDNGTSLPRRQRWAATVLYRKVTGIAPGPQGPDIDPLFAGVRDGKVLRFAGRADRNGIELEAVRREVSLGNLAYRSRL